MKSPFPGMDPYLERSWRDLHARLTTYASNVIQSQLPDDLRARIEEQLVIGEDDRRGRRAIPDVSVVERPKGNGHAVHPDEQGGGVATLSLSKPYAIALEWLEVRHRWVQILDLSAGRRVVTAVEFLSPANKSAGRGLEPFLEKQRDFIAAGVNLVEVDLTRTGRRVLAGYLSELPDEVRTPYQACIHRASRIDRAEVHRLPLRERLPVLPVPLRPGENDVALDLQALIDQAYEDGRYDETDYSRDPVPPLTGEDAAWADGLLKGKGLR